LKRSKRRRDPLVKMVSLLGLAAVCLVVIVAVGDSAARSFLLTICLFLALIIIGGAMRSPPRRTRRR
jgi:peptidoglycan/LPS O-acetylase OafA/YrhL